MAGHKPICLYCKHFHQELKQIETCDAYPKGIRALFLESGKDHFKPFDGDNDIQFELDPEMDVPAIRLILKRRKALDK